MKTILTCSCPKQVKNTTHAVPRFRGAHVSQSGAPRGIPSGFNVTTPTWTNDREVKPDLGTGWVTNREYRLKGPYVVLSFLLLLFCVLCGVIVNRVEKQM